MNLNEHKVEALTLEGERVEGQLFDGEYILSDDVPVLDMGDYYACKLIEVQPDTVKRLQRCERCEFQGTDESELCSIGTCSSYCSEFKEKDKSCK